MNNITLREAVPEDLPFLVEAEKASFSVPWSENVFRSAIDTSLITVFIAEIDSFPAGYGCVSIIPPEAEILNIAVLPKHRGLGIGRQLLQAMLYRGSELGADTAFLEVRESNHPARRLYESAGFAHLGIRANYYDKPKENAVIMQKSPL